jgi:hypothetical protein
MSLAELASQLRSAAVVYDTEVNRSELEAFALEAARHAVIEAQRRFDDAATGSLLKDP